MSWSTKEKIAVLRSICILAGSDSKVAPEETNFVMNFNQEMGLSPSSIQDAFEITDNEMWSTISNFTDAEKETVKILWVEIIKADNIVADEELIVFIGMAERCGIDINEYFR
jgi:hypothetical protein